jgi:hypothetical protein
VGGRAEVPVIYTNHTVFRAPPSVADAMDAIEAQQRAPYVGGLVRAVVA